MPKKVDDLFLVVALKERLSISPNLTRPAKAVLTRNSSGDEIASVNFLYDDIVHAVKIQ